MAVELTQIEAFMVLAEELHFGRASERLYVSQPMISRRVASLERAIGGPLFERTSRRVRLTPLGEQLRAGVRPAQQELLAAIATAQNMACGLNGVLRLGFVATVPSEAVTRLVGAFAARHPDCEVILTEHAITGDNWDVWAPLRRGDTDVLLYFNQIDEPDLTTGPVIEHRDRVLLVANNHRLATRRSISIEDLADEHLAVWPVSLPRSVRQMINPSHTPTGRPLSHTERVRSFQEAMTLVARGRIVHPTVTGNALARRDDILAVPLDGLPPLPLGLIWCTAHENGRVRALAQVARTLQPSRPPRAARTD